MRVSIYMPILREKSGRARTKPSTVAGSGDGVGGMLLNTQFRKWSDRGHGRPGSLHPTRTLPNPTWNTSTISPSSRCPRGGQAPHSATVTASPNTSDVLRRLQGPGLQHPGPPQQEGVRLEMRGGQRPTGRTNERHL